MQASHLISNLSQQLTVFSQHYNDPLLSDIILEADDNQQIHAHRVVLASQSASFKAMFQVGSCTSRQMTCVFEIVYLKVEILICRLLVRLE